MTQKNTSRRRLNLIAMGIAMLSGILFVTPAVQAEENLDMYRYMNQRCEFSFQLPDAPSSSMLWGEHKSPLKIIENTGVGEFAEVISHKKSNYTGDEFFDLTSHCFFLKNNQIENLNEASIIAELEGFEEKLELKNITLKAQTLPNGLIAAMMSGFQVDEESEGVTSYKFDVYRGEKSLMFIETKFNADNIDNGALYKVIKNSFIYDK